MRPTLFEERELKTCCELLKVVCVDMSGMTLSRNETIECPFCRKGNIDITVTREYYSYRTARAFGKVKRIPVVHPEKIEIHSKCPNCGKSKKEIKQALERGQTRELSHKESIEMLKKRGLPLRIETKCEE